MTRLVSLLVTAVLFPSGAGVVAATDLYPWRDHAALFNFLFGNEIDIHQQTRQRDDRDLFGFFYIQFTGVVTKDRYRVATHVDCNATTSDCTVVGHWTAKRFVQNSCIKSTVRRAARSMTELRGSPW